MHRLVHSSPRGLVLLVLLAGNIPWASAEQRPSARRPQQWVVLIGVNDYSELRKLRFAGNDQRALAEQFAQRGFPKDQIYLLDDKAADKVYLPTQRNIEKRLDQVLGMAERGDLVIVGFSGHGVQLDGKSYLCPEDARIDKLAETSVSMDQVYDRLTKCKATFKLLLVDACRNDILPEGRKSVGISRSVGGFSAGKEKPPEGIMQLTSCAPGQVSWEDETFSHGVFMHYLLEGLRGEAANRGQVTLVGLYEYASLNTRKYVDRQFSDLQTPALKGEISGPFEICPPLAAKEITNTLGMKLVLIPAGEFTMGSRETSAELARAYERDNAEPKFFEDEHPAHLVRITRPFYLGACPVTVAQFSRFVADTNYRTDAEKSGKGGRGVDAATKRIVQKAEFSWRNNGFPQGEDHPVANVSWNDANEFCRWLSGKENASYRLPSEAQWEYACRAGSKTHYWFGDDFEPTFIHESLELALPMTTSPAGRSKPNPFGLFDMHGNVRNWCSDWYGENYYAAAPADDPAGPDSGTYRVLRGGSWGGRSNFNRSANRNWYSPDQCNCHSGFRVLRTP
jgi:formylglycine-generating enzyme required for sulfatase activity